MFGGIWHWGYKNGWSCDKKKSDHVPTRVYRYNPTVIQKMIH